MYNLELSKRCAFNYNKRDYFYLPHRDSRIYETSFFEDLCSRFFRLLVSFLPSCGMPNLNMTEDNSASLSSEMQ